METPSPSDRSRNGRASTLDGLVGGLLGGVAVIVLFFVLDGIRGELLRTPVFLASALFGRTPEAVGAGSIAGFTLVHLAVFAAVGAGSVWVFRLARAPENVLLGGIFGLLVLTLLFYLALSLADVAVLEAPEWPAVLLGNFVAGAVLGGYLHWAGPRPGVVGLVNLVREHPVLREGLIVGLLGAVVVAVWFLVVDVIVRDPFFTPAALASMLFYGADGPEAVVVSAGTVLGYTVVHLAAFVIVGVVGTGIVAGLEEHPGGQYAVVLLFAILAVVFVGFVTVLGVWILGELAVWAVLVGNLLAALAMGTYLWRGHPGLREQMRSLAQTRATDPETAR